jgi:pyruvate dehydrogenase E2 component (dihydrolipoamide acetyltransferase)
MVEQFKFPDVGEGITEGEVVEWLVKEGDQVTEDQDIVKIETDKAVVNLPSPATGTILKIYKKQGETIKVGEVLVDIGSSGEKSSAPKEEVKETPSEKPKIEKKPKTKPVAENAGSVVGELEVGTDEIEAPQEAKSIAKKISSKVKALPAVRKLAKELGVDLNTIEGSGENGRILAKDLRSAFSQGGEQRDTEHLAKVAPKVVKKYDMWGYVDRVPLKGMRKKIKENMEIQARIPTVIHMDEIDVTDLYNLRKREKKKMPEGVNLTFLPFVIKALIIAAKKYPIVFSVLEGEEIIIKKYYNIGIAVATDDGLIVPVLKGTDQKSISQMAKELQDLAQKARERTLDLMDLKGSAFTITNVGSIGGLFATPIINPGESSILGLGRIHDKPVVSGNRIKTIKVRKVLPISLAFDHRVYDGAHAALFVNALKEYLEDPEHLLLELV